MKLLTMQNNVKVLVVGLGTQGKKRMSHLGADLGISVDPLNPRADYKSVEMVPTNDYDLAIVCTPDQIKDTLISYFVEKNKHVLCEKPLVLSSKERFSQLDSLSKSKGVLIHTAYNHRFEPAIFKTKELLDSNVLGGIYSINLTYGNGTARLVADSAWKDVEPGVVADLGSHLLDILRYFFPEMKFSFKPVFADANENKASDHALLVSSSNQPRITLEMSLCMWKNSFECEVVGELGSVHLSGLSKWGPVKLVHRTRRLPSGIPEEVTYSFPQGDNSWMDEYVHFKNLIERNQASDLSHDQYIYEQLFLPYIVLER